MDFQKYTDYLGDRWDDTIEMGKFDTYEIALEQVSIIEHDLETGKNGLPKGSTLELIQFITEEPHPSGNKFNEDGWIVVLHKPENVTDVTNDTDGSEVGNQADAEQKENKGMSHSEQRNIDLSKPDFENDIFPPKKVQMRIVTTPILAEVSILIQRRISNHFQKVKVVIQVVSLKRLSS